MSVIRLKRLANEDPAEALVVEYKRKKLEKDESNESSENKFVFHFVGTLDSKCEKNINDVAKVVNDLRKNPKTPKLNAVKNLKEEVKNNSKINRYKLIDSLRKVPEDPNNSKNSVEDGEEELEIFNVYDAENELKAENVSQSETITCNDVPMQNHSASDFVYDLYYTECVPTSSDVWDLPVSIEGYPYPEVTLGTEQDSDADLYEDEDDSNSESNWRNDYPDKDPEASDSQSASDNDDYGDHIGEYNEEAEYLANYEDDDEYDSCTEKMRSFAIDHDYGQFSKTSSHGSDSADDSDEEK